jgi:hypothetical protein
VFDAAAGVLNAFHVDGNLGQLLKLPIAASP